MRYPTMFALLLNLLATLRSAFRTRAELALANLALRRQLATLSQTAPRPRLRRLDRAFWIAPSRIWHRSADALVLVFLVLRHDRRRVVPFNITESVRRASWRLASSRMLGPGHRPQRELSAPDHQLLLCVLPQCQAPPVAGQGSPEPRAVQPPSMGHIVEISEVGGLHHRYERRAA
jgi:hypothetical protein